MEKDRLGDVLKYFLALLLETGVVTKEAIEFVSVKAPSTDIAYATAFLVITGVMRKQGDTYVLRNHRLASEMYRALKTREERS